MFIIVPFSVEFVLFNIPFFDLFIGYFYSCLILFFVQTAFTTNPIVVVVAPIKLRIANKKVKGLVLQFNEIYEKRRCSILFHWLVSGG